MKRSLYVTGSLFIFLAALAVYWAFQWPKAGPSNADDSKEEVHPRPDQPCRAQTVDETTHVIFPGLQPLKFTGRRIATIEEIAAPLGALENISDETLQSFRRDKFEILSDDEGNIASISANEGLFPSVSRRNEVVGIFKRAGIEIIRLGNEAANVNNKAFMRGLLQVFGGAFLLSVPEPTGSGRATYVPTGPLIMLPITYIDRRKPYSGESSADEQPGLLWMAKSDGLPSDIAAMWHESIPIEDARWVEWCIVPINLHPEAGQYWQVLDYYNRRIGTPDFIFERKIRTIDDPPDPPIPPASRGPVPSGS